jgi:quercetin dioxygenase-like cupin family protein
MYLPKELSKLFQDRHFSDYPFVEIPQSFTDDRGRIDNLADGVLGDVAVISSVKGAIRANHVHLNDWHFSYLAEGSMDYIWKDVDGVEKSTIATKGQMLFTPPGVPHKMIFLEDSFFIAISAKNRSSDDYEQDTTRLPFEFFIK